MVIEITLLLAAGLGNFAWDVTGRRVSARLRRRARRARRSTSLVEWVASGSTPPEVAAPAEFVETTRRTIEELDRVVDHFDLVLLRAEAAEALVGDLVFVGAQAPRVRAKDCLDAWLSAVDALPASIAHQLRDCGLPDEAIRSIVFRERERCMWPRAETASDVLEQTASEFEHAFALLGGFLAALGGAPRDPYR